MSKAAKTSSGSKPKVDQVVDYLKENPDATSSEIDAALDIKVNSALASYARRKLGIGRAGRGKTLRPVTCEDLDLASELCNSLGISIKETRQTLELVDGFIDQISSFERGIKALEKLEKYAG